MERRRYPGAIIGVVATTSLSGCLQGNPVLRKQNIGPAGTTAAWEVDLEAGNELRLDVEKTDDGVSTVTGYVHRTETGEAVVSTAGTSGHEPFEVPATGTYAVSLDIDGATASVVLRDMN